MPILSLLGRFLKPSVCHLLLAALLLVGVLSRLSYLHNSPPIDLSGDEAHYWDWSRQLDWSYYSKGPLVALIIRASTEIFGSTMPAVRYPAVLLAVCTSLCSYWLTFHLFRSWKLALGVVALTHLVPLFVVGSMLMTIDPPFYFCWALATCIAARSLLPSSHVYSKSLLPWVLMGGVIGIGFLAKFAAPLWFVGLFVFLLLHRPVRFFLFSIKPYIALATTSLFFLPVLYWNSQNNWVNFRHVAAQTGAQSGKQAPLSDIPANVAQYLGGQLGVLGPFLAILMIAAVVFALRQKSSPSRPAYLYLICIGLTFFLLTLVSAFRTSAELNWPAPAYFTGMILTAAFIATRLESPLSWRRWKFVFWPLVALGLIITPLAHDMTRAYPLLARVHSWFSDEPFEPRKIDPSFRLMGHAELGRHLGTLLADMPAGSFIMAENYQVTGLTAFYAPGQPVTYYVGTYFADPDRRARQSQYDLWPNRSLEPTNPAVVGKDALFIGFMNDDLASAFDSVERLPDLHITRNGSFVRLFRIWKCKQFKGIPKPGSSGDY